MPLDGDAHHGYASHSRRLQRLTGGVHKLTVLILPNTRDTPSSLQSNLYVTRTKRNDPEQVNVDHRGSKWKTVVSSTRYGLNCANYLPVCQSRAIPAGLEGMNPLFSGPGALRWRTRCIHAPLLCDEPVPKAKYVYPSPQRSPFLLMDFPLIQATHTHTFCFRCLYTTLLHTEPSHLLQPHPLSFMMPRKTERNNKSAPNPTTLKCILVHLSPIRCGDGPGRGARVQF